LGYHTVGIGNREEGNVRKMTELKEAANDGRLVLGLWNIDPLADAVAWKKKNLLAYYQFAAWATDDVAHGARPSIALYFELARRPWMAAKLGMARSSATFLLNNTMRADIARLLNRECQSGFPTRRSIADVWQESTERATDAP